MKIQLLKDLPLGNKDAIIEVTKDKGTYLVRLGAAIEYKETVKKKKTKKK